MKFRDQFFFPFMLCILECLLLRIMNYTDDENIKKKKKTKTRLSGLSLSLIRKKV